MDVMQVSDLSRAGELPSVVTQLGNADTSFCKHPYSNYALISYPNSARLHPSMSAST